MNCILSLPVKSLLLFLSLAMVVVLPMNAGAQSMVQVPFVSVAAGVPASTYNGSDSVACAPSTPGYIDFYGDGCMATQAVLTQPQGLAIDTYDNIILTDGATVNNANVGTTAVRVVYNGGAAMAAAIVAANPGLNLTPTPGHIYPMGKAGGGALTATSGKYYCTGTSGMIALDAYGDGCPASYAAEAAHYLQVDSLGNIFFNSIISGFYNNRVIYVQGAALASLITKYNPSVVTPQVGYIYNISNTNDFVTTTDIAIDSQENVYASDRGAVTTGLTGLQSTTKGNQIKKFTGTGWTTYIANTGNVTGGVNGDGGPATSATVSGVYNLLFDKYDNLYILDSGNSRIRVVYNKGTTPPLYIQGASGTIITNPVPGNIYSVAGGGSVKGVTGTPASNISYGTSGAGMGLDHQGNLYFRDSYGDLWREDATTGIANIVGFYGAGSVTGSASSAPAAGVACNGKSGGPLMTDAYGDGCPATQIYPLTPAGRTVFDSANNFYLLEGHGTTAAPNGAGIVRKYTYNSQFGSVATGATSALPIALTPSTNTTYTSPTGSYLLTGSTTGEFFSKGGDLCSSTAGVNLTTQTCVFNANFAPTQAGPQLGALQVTSGVTTLTSLLIGGTGVGAQIALDSGTRTTIGATLSPSGVDADQAGNIYIADATTKSIYRSVAGGTPTVFASGFSAPDPARDRRRG